MPYQTISKKKYNEDAAACSSHTWIVADGATGLFNPDQMKTGSDAAWFSHTLADELFKRLESHPQEPLKQALEAVIAPLRDVFPAGDPQSRPSAALAVLTQRPDGHYDWLTLGDCVLLAQTDEGVEEFYDDSVTRLDQIALDEMARQAKVNHTSLLEQKEAIRPLLIHHRTFKNKPGGYGVADLSQDWKDLAQEGSFQAGILKRAALMSDGFYQYKENHHLDSASFMDQIMEKGFFLMEILKEELDADDQCERWPRLSVRDDMTLLITEELF